MKLQNLFLTLFAAAALFAGCKEDEPEPSVPSLIVGQTELTFEQGGGTATLTVTSNRPWFITSDADWLAFNPSQGAASDSPVSVTVTALSNSSMDRTSSFKVSTDFDYRSVTVSQKGQKGEDPNVTPSGKGTLEDPYNVVAAINATSGLSWTSNDEYQTTGVVYVKGKISRIAEKGSFTDGGTFGNASFFISADGTTTKELQVYRCLYLGNKKYKSGQTDIKVGDEVIICGKLMNYKGNTPETDANNAYVYSLNGETGSQGGEEPEPKGTGTLEDPYNPTGAAAAVANLKWTDNKTYETTGVVYVKGKISSITDAFSATGDYGNASFFISEDGTANGEFQVFRTMYLGNKKFKSGQTDIKVGDEVIICGKLMNYHGNTPETDANNSYIYSLNGETGESDQPEDHSDAVAKTVADFIAAADKETFFKLTGTVSGFNSQYCSFDVEDATGKIYVYSVANKDEWSSKIANGGTVTLAGKYDYYEAKQQHEVIEAQILSFEAAAPVEAKDATVAEAIAAENDALLNVGPAVVVASASAGFLMEQDGALIYVYGGKAKVGDNVTVIGTKAEYGDAPQLTDPKITTNSTGAEVTYPEAKDITSTFESYSSTTREFVTYKGTLSIENDKYFNITVGGIETVTGSIVKPVEDISSLNGKEVTIKGYYLYTTTAKSGDKYLYVIATDINGTAITGEGGDEPGSGDEPGGEVSGDFTSNVKWTKGESATDAKATVNGKEITALKLGTSSKTGTATIVLPKGSTSITFYGVSWKGKKAKFLAKIGDKEFFTQDLATNDGAAGNPPFTMTVTASDCYTKTFEALATDTTVTLTTTGSNSRIILFGINVK